MHRTLVAFAIALISQILPSMAHAQDEACHARVESLFNSGAIGLVKRGEMRRDCARAVYGQDPIREEYWAYWIYLSSEVEAGRMTLEQARYLVLQKENELNAKRNAQILQLLPYAVEADRQNAARQYQPYRSPPPPPTYNTNCTTDPWGNTNCTTTRQ